MHSQQLHTGRQVFKFEGGGMNMCMAASAVKLMVCSAVESEMRVNFVT